MQSIYMIAKGWFAGPFTKVKNVRMMGSVHASILSYSICIYASMKLKNVGLYSNLVFH